MKILQTRKQNINIEGIIHQDELKTHQDALDQTKRRKSKIHAIY